MSPEKLFNIPRSAVISQVKKKRTSTGSKRVMKIAQDATMRPGKRKKTTAKEAGIETASLPIVIPTAIIRLLTIMRVTGVVSTKPDSRLVSMRFLPRLRPGRRGIDPSSDVASCVAAASAM